MYDQSYVTLQLSGPLEHFVHRGRPPPHAQLRGRQGACLRCAPHPHVLVVGGAALPNVFQFHSEWCVLSAFPF